MWSESSRKIASISYAISQTSNRKNVSVDNGNTFVANRVGEIQRIVPEANWNHVKSKDNPADILSRREDAQQLSKFKLWWSGPNWLAEKQDKWIIDDYVAPSDVPERKKNVSPSSTVSTFKLIENFSSLGKLKRIVAYVLGFKHNCLYPDKKRTDFLTVIELDKAMNSLIRICQKQTFSHELKCLQYGRSLDSHSKLLSLHPFLDKNIIKVGGRLSHADIPEAQRHPAILPKDHPLVKLIVLHEHYQNLHVGPRGLLATLRLRFWITDVQRTVNGLLRKCLVCFKMKPTSLCQLMGDLPFQRVTPARPFFKCGIDFAGPFTIRTSRNVTGKAYFSVFVGFTTKAVHIEVVSAVSTPAFLNALKRFISRRGRSEQIFTDNGTNFVGACNELKAESLSTSQARDEIGSFLASKSIKWSFIPSFTPHFGGLWETAVKSAKTHLTKVIGLTSLTFEELSTVAAKIEAVLNSRPLCPLSNDLNNFEPLTPGHFIIGEPLIAIPEPDYKDIPQNRTTRYGLLIQMKERFWDRWSREYLTQLQQRSKWKRILPDQLKPGLLVLLKEDNTSPLTWPTGRIVEVTPGKDGLTRVVFVKVAGGKIFKRSLPTICVLPCEID